MIPEANRAKIWLDQLKPYSARLTETPELIVEGRLSRMVGLTLEAVGCRAAIGSRCRIETKNGRIIEAEVVGFSGARVYLMPTGEPHGLEPDCRVIPLGRNSLARVGYGLLGRSAEHRRNFSVSGYCNSRLKE